MEFYQRQNLLTWQKYLQEQALPKGFSEIISITSLGTSKEELDVECEWLNKLLPSISFGEIEGPQEEEIEFSFRKLDK